MTPQLPLIVCDLDGTLVNVMDEVLEHLCLRYSVALRPEDCQSYSISSSFGSVLRALGRYDVSDEELHKILAGFFLSPDIYARAKPYWQMHASLHAFIKAGGHVIPLTWRPKTQAIIEATEDWLFLRGYGNHCLFAQDFEDAGPRSGKFGALTVIDLEKSRNRRIWFIDDDPTVAKEIAEALPRTDVFMPVQPWTEAHFDPELGIRRDFYEAVAEAVTRTATVRDPSERGS